MKPFRKPVFLQRFLILIADYLPNRKPRYLKPHLTFEQQLERLGSRGLTIPDKAMAERFLRQINYYRLSAYARIFYRTPNEEVFCPGTTFDQVKSLDLTPISGPLLS